MNNTGGEFKKFEHRRIETRVMHEVPPEWLRLMEVAARIDRGRATVIFNEGKPVQVDIAVKKIKLDSGEDFEQKLKTIPLL